MPHDWGWGMGLLMLLFWVAVIVGIVLLVVWLTQRGQTRPEDPLEILKRRYARGEINKEEYEQRRRDLST